MDFTLTDEQRMLAESLRGLLDAECTVPQLRRMLDMATARDAGRWRKLFELGLGGVLAPEAAGGLGLGELDFALAAEECGRALLPEPLVEQAGIAVPLLAALGRAPSPAPLHPSSTGLSRGSTSGRGTALASSADRHDVDPRDKPGDDGERAADVLAAVIAGDLPIALGHPLNPFVIDADIAEFLLLPRDNEIHLVERQHVELTPEPGIDPFRRLFRVDWTPTSDTMLADAEQGQLLWDAALDRGALFAAAQGLGIAQRAVQIATDYAKERQQFGKPIGSYQAIKHHLATVQVKLEFARPVVYAAAALFTAGDSLSAARISHAKLAACDAAELACRTAIQVHGAMGYSWEVDVHFFLKRALALAGAWGDRGFHQRRVAHRLFETDLPVGPDQIFAKECDRHVA
jgi:Acyl-CoA dehydrogenase, C-terminal domain/Acyl-CoA dehydrogenase, N-terminal domain